MREKFVYGLFFIIAICIGAIGTMTFYKLVPNTVQSVSNEIKEVKVTESDTIASSISKVYDSVLYIEAVAGRTSSTGTGFVYKVDDKYGYVITNNHVVEEADSITVTTSAGEKIQANLLGTDAFADIAVLVIDKTYAKQVAEIGDSTKSVTGDTIFTVGSPLGINYINTVTKGIISGINRTVTVKLTNGEFLMDVLQVDASINPGNSGGPLCNINGEVIGVTSMKLVDSSVEGMGFAIPIEIAMTTVKKIESGEKIIRPYLGFEALSVTDTWQLYRNQVYLDNNITEGVAIVSYDTESPIKTAGLKKGDVITKVNNINITSVAQLRYVLYNFSVGDTVKITYIRNNKTEECNLVLDKGLNS